MTTHKVEQLPRSFAFDTFVLIPERQLLLRGETPVRIGGRALDILAALVEHPGEVVTKRELLAKVWPGNARPKRGNLKVNMTALRRALGEDATSRQYIATVGRPRFIALSLRSMPPDRPRALFTDAIEGKAQPAGGGGTDHRPKGGDRCNPRGVARSEDDIDRRSRRHRKDDRRDCGRGKHDRIAAWCMAGRPVAADRRITGPLRDRLHDRDCSRIDRHACGTQRISARPGNATYTRQLRGM